LTTSVRSRFTFSFGANLLKALIGFLTGMLVARGLGPDQYGKMMFLLGTFTALRSLLDVGSSTAFFTFLSQRQRSKKFVAWFSAWLGVQFLVPLLAVGLIFPAAWVDVIWKGEQRSLVVLAFVAAYLQSTLWTVVMQMGESQRLTRAVQGIAAAVGLLHLLVVAAAWSMDWLGIRLILAAIAIEWALAAWLVATRLRFAAPTGEKEGFGDVLREFGRYCLPLVPYSWIGFAYEFADRWLLQNFGGSVHQAYYAVAFQFGAIAAIATSSILNVFWKEIAEAHQQGNRERVAALYRKVSRGLFFVAASVAGFLIPWSEDLLRLLLGPAYVGGATVLAIMLLYPLHQSMGQIGGTMLYATGRVRAQVTIGMLFMAASIVITYFVLAPAEAQPPGFGLGAEGLAGKMVILQLIAVNVVALYLARSMQIGFDWAYQALSGFGCLGLGWLAHLAAGSLPGISASIWIAMPMAAVLYICMLATLVWLSPSLAGLDRNDIMLVVRRIVPAGFGRGAKTERVP
jgi:O-antigen/teichoic acid export membrane protein